jgi:hypothetical protein
MGSAAECEVSTNGMVRTIAENGVGCCYNNGAGDGYGDRRQLELPADDN